MIVQQGATRRQATLDSSRHDQSICYFHQGVIKRCSGPHAFSLPASARLYIISASDVTALISVEEAQVVDGVERGRVLRSPCLLFTSQRTVVHHLCIFVTALSSVEEAQVVDGVERGRVLRSPCLLITGQRTVVHHLRIFVTALISVEEAQVVDGV
jgi:hypothetical protein